jgi:tRNA (guanine37-N1)-methyltransferase
MSPRGRALGGELARELAAEQALMILCGRYEGVDQRALDAYGFEEVSIGDYILTGGEIPAMALMDAVCRLLPGALGSDVSHAEESIYSGLLEYPQYTRPAEAVIRGERTAAPDILLSGHHRQIHLWQYRHSLALTRQARPDLWDAYVRAYAEGGPKAAELAADERAVLAEVIGG